MSIYSKTEIRDIIVAISILGSCLLAGYCAKQSQKQKTVHRSDNNTQVLVHSAHSTKTL